MFLGHYAVGFAAKRFAPKVSLGWLIAAPLFLDLLWPIALITGVESVRVDPAYSRVTPLDLHDYPYTHSLAGSLVWTVLFAGLYFALRRDGRGSLVLALGVMSHFVLDWVTHPPDMPLWPGSATQVGLGLWNSLPGTLGVELALWIAGIAIYFRTTRATRPRGTLSLVALIVFLSIMYFGAVLGPPPPNAKKIVAYMSLSQWLLLYWAWSADRYRTISP
jgi:membrane-bound metal-dependent hydrolase YbcI (DUF457 family)